MLATRCDFALDEGGEGEDLVVGLTSLGNALGAPPKPDAFEWRYFLRSSRCHRLFLIDCFQHWYLGPILGFSHSVDQTAARIIETKARLGAQRLIFIGSSMGGFGTMLLGAITRADLAIAIAPQTSVDGAFLKSIGDRRWPQKTSEINNVGYPHADLRDLYQATGGPQRTHILYDAACSDDGQHADRLAAFSNVQVEDVGYGGHGCAYEMAKNGRMTQIVEAALAPNHSRSSTY
ncbi:pimeloyl-ACP methyl ester carboxylesterase [Methylobacterium sp. OAE515]|uniref:alpha/beta fold hydrolase n=1 Tax=Methylobacterium sp. OAE515 TaxID=2817895 RepID=UPI00178B96DE